MMFKQAFTLTFISCIILAQSQEQGCKEVTTVENFDIETYASAKWYSHQQAENEYLPIKNNYCVTAEYTILDEPTSLWGYTVGVNNKAQDVTGDVSGGDLCAYSPESDSKLAVAPCFLPKQAAGPYWVVAYDETEGYSLVSGGQPDEVSPNGGCTTGSGVNNSGLWIFTRSQTRNDTLINKVRDIAIVAGFDISVLNNVTHTSCGPEEEDATLSLVSTCLDDEGEFNIGFGRIKTTCEWVSSHSILGCFFYSSKCPATCGGCD